MVSGFSKFLLQEQIPSVSVTYKNREGAYTEIVNKLNVNRAYQNVETPEGVPTRL